MNTSIRVAVGLLTVALIAAPAAAAQDPHGAHKMESPDHHFVMEAATGGMAEVHLGQMAVEKASNDEVKQFGQRMVTDHGAANQELTQLAGQKGMTLPTAMHEHHKQMADRLSELSGAEFDREYMKMMVMDHDKDVRAFENQAKNGKDADVKAWAAKTLPTLREHAQLARDIAGRVGAQAPGGSR